LRHPLPYDVGMLQHAHPSGFIEPCLPSPADKPPRGPGWLRERYSLIVEAVERLEDAILPPRFAPAEESHWARLPVPQKAQVVCDYSCVG
jgi:hypothetical protein